MTRIHFFVLRHKDGRTFFLTLPGQTIGRNTQVLPGIIVKPRKGVEALFRKFRKNSPDGTVFFTRSLRWEYSCYSAGDMDFVSDLYGSEGKLVFPETEQIRQEWEQYKLNNDISS